MIVLVCLAVMLGCEVLVRQVGVGLGGVLVLMLVRPPEMVESTIRLIHVVGDMVMTMGMQHCIVLVLLPPGLVNHHPGLPRHELPVRPPKNASTMLPIVRLCRRDYPVLVAASGVTASQEVTAGEPLRAAHHATEQPQLKGKPSMSSPVGEETWHLLECAHYAPAASPVPVGSPLGCAVCREDRRVVRLEPAIATARSSPRRPPRSGP